MAIVNITVTNDADFYKAFQYATAGEPPVPIDLTGSTMEMMLRRRAEDETALLRLGTDTGEIVIIDAANGMFTVRIPQDTLARLGLGDYEHSNIMTQTTGHKSKIWSGLFSNNAGPTR